MKWTSVQRKIPQDSGAGVANMDTPSTGGANVIAVLRPAWAVEQIEQT